MNPPLKKSKKESSADRISDLPDALIHHIFSFLDMRDVVHTSFLSNRWKTLWSSTPNLNFSLLFCQDCLENISIYDHDNLCDSCLIEKENFMGFVDRVLFLRGNYKINKFKLYCYELELDTARVKTWILAALSRNVWHLVLEADIFNKTWELPHKLFTANITMLELSFGENVNNQARLPSLICTAPRIKNLQLYSVVFPDGNANAELILGCPVLKTLSIIQCDLRNIKVFTISTPQLESLELRSIYTNSHKSCQVKTCIPDLKMIEVSANWCNDGINSMLDYCLENLTSLASAKVGFHSDFIPKKEFSEWFMKVVTGIHNVQSLNLSSCSLQFLADFPESFSMLSDMFSNLKCVILEKPSPPYAQAVLKLFFGKNVQWRNERGGVYLRREKN